MLYEGQLDEAREVWEEVLAEKPQHLLAQKGLGVIAVMEEDPSQALTYLEAVSTADPEDIFTRFYIGLALEALKRPAEAAGELRYVIEKGEDPELLRLAETHLQMIQE
jgi:predicted Zn-dependent protease